MLPQLEKAVVGSSDKWSQRLGAVLSEASGTPVTETYKKYNHYQEKVQAMTQDKRAGKLTSSAQKEAYTRNQDKLSAARTDYTRTRDKVVTSLDAEASVSLDEANKILLRVLQFSQAYYQQGAEAVSSLAEARSTIDHLVKNPPQRTRPSRESACEDSENESDAESDGSMDVAPRKGRTAKPSGLSSSDEDTPPARNPRQKGSQRNTSQPAEDSLMAFETEQSTINTSSGSLSPRTQEWQRKNEQRILMGLPPKEHPEGPHYVQSQMPQAAPPVAAQDPGMMLVADSTQSQQTSQTDDLLASFGTLDMSAQPAQPAQPAQQPQQQFQQYQQPTANPFQQQQAFQQQQYQQPMMGGQMGGQMGGYPMQGQMPMGGVQQQPMGGAPQQYQGMQPMMLGNQGQQTQQAPAAKPSPFQPFC
jgi:hypothetical protein